MCHVSMPACMLMVVASFSTVRQWVCIYLFTIYVTNHLPFAFLCRRENNIEHASGISTFCTFLENKKAGRQLCVLRESVQVGIP